jgi:hypothetical protein
MTGVHGRKAEDITEEHTVRLGVFAVDDYVSASDHWPLQGRKTCHGEYGSASGW